jgi:arylsulfatase A-like enzyme
MDPEFVTMAELLKTNGFFCSAFTGGGYVSAAFGFAEGFDSYYERTDEVLLDKAAELCLRDAARWIEQNRHKNFFLFIHTYQPHDPYACPSPYKTLFLSENSRWGHINLTGYLGGKSGIFKELPADERQNIVDLYDAEIRYTDEQLIRPLIQKLKDLSLYDQTLIVFTSDHGEEFFEHNGWGHGHSLYDESLRVPLIVKFPEFGYKGAKVGSIVSLVDVLPTILDYLRINPKRYEFDGRSLLPLLEGRERGDRTFLSDVGENVLNLHLPQKIAMNLGPLKLILNKALHKKDSAFFQYPPPAVRAVELFDLSADAAERINIVDRESQTAARILDRIEDTFSRAKQQKPGKAVLDEELKEQLRALGYIK